MGTAPLSYALLSLPSPPSPVIFEAGPFALRYYGLFIALGIAAATWLTGRELSRKGYDSALALDSLFLVIPFGFVGARVYHVITDYGLYAEDPIPGIFEVWNGGLGIYGAVAGGFLGVLLFSWYRGISPLVFADANAFHPTFLYESIWDLLVCLALLWIARRFANRLRDGDLMLIYVSLYSVGRFFVETLRVDPAFLIGESFRGNLLVSSVLALGSAMVLLLRHARSPRKRPDAG